MFVLNRKYYLNNFEIAGTNTWSSEHKVSDYTDDPYLQTANLTSGVGSFCNIINWGNDYRDIVVAGILHSEMKNNGMDPKLCSKYLQVDIRRAPPKLFQL